jgi:hypothetical protein
MALLLRIYFNGVFGALGGLLGWMLFNVLAEPIKDRVPMDLVEGACIGGLIGYLVVAVDAIRDRSLVRFCRLASYGVVLGTIGGAAGLLLADEVNLRLVGALGAERGNPLVFLGAVLARGLCWSLLGVAVGISEGVAARSRGKLSYGTLGGFLGGFLGGCLFDLCYRATGAASAPHSFLGSLWTALGLMILGACIGALSALVQGVFQPALVKVMRGWQEGREYPLLRASTVLGRDEHADIALFRDMKVEKRHATIRREGGDRYVLVNAGAPTEQTRVNDEPVPQKRELHDGDRIQLGNVVLRFHRRAARAQAGKRPARPSAAAARPSPLGKT